SGFRSRAQLGPRVRAVIDLAEPARVDVAVHLRRRERGVTEQLLDRAEIGAALEQVGCERMPEPVRMTEDPAHRARVEPSAPHREKEGLVSAADEPGAPVAEVAGELRGGFFPEWN